MRKTISLYLSLLVMLGASAALAGCAVDDTPPVSTSTVEALALRLASAQLDNGAFDWRQNAYPYVTTVSGFLNVTGVTALGLADVYERFPDKLSSISPVLQDVADYLLAAMQGHLDGSVSSVSLSNYIFMRRFRDVMGLPATDWNVVTASFTKIMNDRNTTDGDTAVVISDGMWNRIYNGRAGIPGIRGWDLAFLYKALVRMDWPQAEIDWVFAKLVSLPITVTDEYADVSIAHVVEVCGLHGAQTQANPLLWRSAIEGLLTTEAAGKSISSSHQATAYAVMGLNAWGDEAGAGPLLEWLESEVGIDGSLPESDGYEYFEIMGEVLQALLMR